MCGLRIKDMESAQKLRVFIYRLTGLPLKNYWKTLKKNICLTAKILKIRRKIRA